MIHVKYLRDAPYRDVLSLQRQLFGDMVERRHRGEAVGDEHLLLVEHRPVYTLGRHGNRANLTHAEWLKDKGAELVEIERGGDITFHGPGQVVAYPIIDLQRHGLGVKTYVELLEQAVIMTMAHYGLEGQRIEGATGVWMGRGTANERKLCAIGIKCSRFISMHGLAMNSATDLSWFSAINPCGFVDRGVTSLSAELGRRVDFDESAPLLATNLLKLLGY
jgi:lipoyl(octanoyl) transferase